MKFIDIKDILFIIIFNNKIFRSEDWSATKLAVICLSSVVLFFYSQYISTSNKLLQILLIGGMHMISQWEVILRLLISAFFGGLIGMEREINNRPAGLRTHVLVSLGACLIMMISMFGFNGEGDPARLAAQVVSGIGFLGAGTILNKGNAIRGLTTAASLWVCGGIGLAVGNGYYVGAIGTSLIVLFTLISLGLLEKRIFKKKYKVLIVQCEEKPGKIGEIGQTFGKHNVSIKDIKIYNDGDVDDGLGSIEIHFAVKIPRNFLKELFHDDLLKIPGIDWAMWADDGEEAEKSKA